MLSFEAKATLRYRGLPLDVNLACHQYRQHPNEGPTDPLPVLSASHQAILQNRYPTVPCDTEVTSSHAIGAHADHLHSRKLDPSVASHILHGHLWGNQLVRW